MLSETQIIIVLLVILISLQLWQCFFAKNVEKFDADNYQSVNYNTKVMNCDGDSNLLNNSCKVISNVPTIQNVCTKKIETQNSMAKNLEDNNSLMELLNENQNKNNEEEIKSIGELDN